MATGYPVKANYATGDILTAANMNDLSNTVNLAVGTTPSTATQMAGKNAIINGDMGIWQRGTTVTATGTGFFYGADRWRGYSQSGTSGSFSRQTFTAGTAPVAGYEGAYFLRMTDTAGSATCYQPIEDVRTFAGQTVTVSFWAKSGSSRNIEVRLDQNFGSGGSTNVSTTLGTAASTTSWQRFSYSVTLPSIAGKTIGTSSYLELQLIGATTNVTMDIWGVQVESGASATPFQTATGTKQGELAACQRYYEKTYNVDTAIQTNTTVGLYRAADQVTAATATQGTSAQFRVTKRTNPTVTLYRQDGSATNPNYCIWSSSNGASNYGAFTVYTPGTNGFIFYPNSISGGTAGQATMCYLHFTADAEL